MNAVERQISATDREQELVLVERVEPDVRDLDHAEPRQDRVQVARLGEDRRPDDPGREVGDREWEQEDVEEEPA